MMVILRQLAVWAGVTLFKAGCATLVGKTGSGKTMLEELADAIEFAERVGKDNKLEGEAKMKLALGELKKSTVKELKSATESRLRALVEMKLNKII